MSFYTCVNRFGNKMLYRGYNDNGERVQTKVPFKPTMYLQSTKSEGVWKAFDGSSVEPIELDSMSEATDFIRSMKTSTTSKFTVTTTSLLSLSKTGFLV